MSKSVILKGGTIVNEGKQFVADILISNNRIQKIYTWLKRHNYDIEMFKIDSSSKKNDNICYNFKRIEDRRD